MADFTADLRDIRFTLFDQCGLADLLGKGRYEGLDQDTLTAVLDEAYKFARSRLAPMNAEADSSGCRYDPSTGEVTVPACFHESYKLFAENGWLALAHSPEWGGQGMPYSLALAANDIFFGGCLSFCLQMLLTTGAAHLIEVFGNDELKQTYIEKMYTGKWTGTMCLTEAGAGSDVGASRTKAVVEGDHYLIEGEKIFISFGDHDLTDNIIHAVLARIEGAPAGTRGLSLFLVPKVRVKADGALGENNHVRCMGIEHKMGIHASPTCTMVFGEGGPCHGYLLGEAGKGMSAMFQMMNEARISVGLQGAALANAAYQYALGYARERVQGKSLTGGGAACIVEHPDVKRMLLWQKALSEGTRALLLRTAVLFDRSTASADEDERQRCHGLVELLTPVCKAYASDMGFQSAVLSLQTLGGYGYLKEYPVEQHLRDNKIASIYEGTNGIQALDLVGRKLGRNTAAMQHFMGMLAKLAAEHAEHPALAGEIGMLEQARESLLGVAMHFGKIGASDPLMPVTNATPFLELFGHVVVGWLLIEQALIAYPRLEVLCRDAGIDIGQPAALGKLCADNPEACFYDGKVKTAQFFARRSLSLCPARAAVLKTADRTALEVSL